jgi:hypothetical protein
MARATPALVASVITVRPDYDVSGAIRSASVVVNQRIPAGAYTEDTLREIETWLAAHFYDVNDPRKERREVDAAADYYEVIKVDLGLNVTKYGQQVALFDAYNYLKPRVRMTVTWLGKCRKWWERF